MDAAGRRYSGGDRTADRRGPPVPRALVRGGSPRATLATDAIIGAFASISSPGTAYVLLHHVMGEAGGAAASGVTFRAAWVGWPMRWRRPASDLRVDIRRESP